jgi:hypothetical protein
MIFNNTRFKILIIFVVELPLSVTDCSVLVFQIKTFDPVVTTAVSVPPIITVGLTYVSNVAVVRISAPLIVEVDPMFTPPLIPTPPIITKAPVLVDVLAVPVLIIIGLDGLLVYLIQAVPVHIQVVVPIV